MYVKLKVSKLYEIFSTNSGTWYSFSKQLLLLVTIILLYRQSNDSPGPNTWTVWMPPNKDCADMIKGLKMGSSSWIIQVNLNCKNKYLPKKTGRDIWHRREGHVMTEADWSYMNISWGMLADPGSWKRQGANIPLQSSKGVQPCWAFDFCPIILISDF